MRDLTSTLENATVRISSVLHSNSCNKVYAHCNAVAIRVLYEILHRWWHVNESYRAVNNFSHKHGRHFSKWLPLVGILAIV